MIKRKKGFTLIELLVVITIIAVLAAILFPVFLMARQKARAMNCMNNMKQLGSFFAMYMSDWNGTFPTTAVPIDANAPYGGLVRQASAAGSVTTYFKANTGGAFPPGPGVYNSELWPVRLETYLKEKAFYAIPGTPTVRMQGIFRCKELGRTWSIAFPNLSVDQAGYGYNFLYLGLPYRAYQYGAGAVTNPTDRRNNWYYTNAGFRRSSAKQTVIKNSAETVCLVDNQYIWAFPPKGADGVSNWVASPTYGGNSLIRPRHNDRTNVAWADGHVSSVDTALLVNQGTLYGKGATVTPNQIGKAVNNDLWDLE